METETILHRTGEIAKRLVCFIGNNTLGRLAGVYPPDEEDTQYDVQPPTTAGSK